MDGLGSARFDSILFLFLLQVPSVVLVVIVVVVVAYYFWLLFRCTFHLPCGIPTGQLGALWCRQGREGKGKEKGQSWGNFVSVSNYQRNAAIVACTWILEQIWLHLPDKIDLLKSFFIALEKEAEEGRERGERYTEKVQRGFLPEKELGEMREWREEM